jgi:hypothetical protein
MAGPYIANMHTNGPNGEMKCAYRHWYSDGFRRILWFGGSLLSLRNVLSLSCILGVFAGMSCMGGQTGTEDEAPGSDASSGGRGSVDLGGDGSEGTADGKDPCSSPVIAIGLDDLSTLGYSAKDLLVWSESATSTTLLWNENTNLVGVGPEKGDSKITVEVLGVASTARVISPTDTALCGKPRLELDGLVSVETAGGALKEVLSVTLVSRDKSHLEFSTPLHLESLVGSLTFDLPTGVSLLGLTLSGILSPGGAEGSLMAQIEETSSASSNNATSTSTVLVLARWPASKD